MTENYVQILDFKVVDGQEIFIGFFDDKIDVNNILIANTNDELQQQITTNSNNSKYFNSLELYHVKATKINYEDKIISIADFESTKDKKMPLIIAQTTNLIHILFNFLHFYNYSSYNTYELFKLELLNGKRYNSTFVL